MFARRRMDEFGKSEEGTVLAIWAVSFAVLFGIVALSFDLGRIAITQTELQSFADSVALAAAGELDGQDDSITRARLAAANLIADTKTYGSGDAALAGAADYTLTFLSALPVSDTVPISAVTIDPRRAIYARVVVNGSTVDLTFAAVFMAQTGAAGPDNTVAASAVAGFTQYACDITPLMFCLPNANYAADDNIGDMIQLRSGGNGAAWGPGNFGFLDPARVLVDQSGPCAGLSPGRLDRCLMGAIGSITQCFVQRGVDTQPGQRVGITNAVFNVRFDIYRSGFAGERTNPVYAPAPNVIKGIIPNSGGSCIGGNERVSPNSVGLPRDACLVAGTCGRVGDGNWAAGRVNYVNVNYGGIDPHPTATTRYQYYLAEIARAGGAASRTAILTGRAETGRPICSNNQSNDPERRVVIAAGIDCTANPINGSATGVPVQEFFRLFLTEPVGDDGTSPPRVDIWAEVVGSAGGAGSGISSENGIFRDVVQLYR